MITFQRLKYLSFAHSGVYLTLLALALADHPAKTVFGWAHGIGWIVISLLCIVCLLYTSPSPRDRTRSRMPSSA